MKMKTVLQNSQAKSIKLALMSLFGSLLTGSMSAGSFDLQVEAGYEFGGCGDSGTYYANPDSGFVIIVNNGSAPFVGELRLDGVSGNGTSGHNEVHDTSGPGFVLAPGSSFRLEAGDESSNYGGYGKNQDDSDPDLPPDDGLKLSIVGTSDGCAINFQVLDKDIHSGTPQVNPFGVTLDNYILQGGDPFGRDTEDDYEVSQTHAVFNVAGTCNKCPLSQGYWKTHTALWPVDSLTLGTVTYTKAQLIAILNSSVTTDASVILAKQLIAALLNIANGSDSTSVSSTIADANSLLGGCILPCKVDKKTQPALFKSMVQDASVLDQYNGGSLTPGCTP